jgi:very-short-patch-repair endonuclease
VTKEFARQMRKRMTDAEMRLWYRLRPMRAHGLAFRRQSALGVYVADFECRKAKLVVEVDGAQHDQPDAQKHDTERTRWLESQGYKVLRFANHDVLRYTDVVIDQILTLAEERARRQMS